MSEIELLPCPFCGGKIKLDEEKENNDVEGITAS